MKRILKHSEFLETRLIKEEFIRKNIEKFLEYILGTYRNITGVTKDRMNWILNNVNPLGQLEDRISKISENERDEYRKKLLDFLNQRGCWHTDSPIGWEGVGLEEENFIRLLYDKLVDSNMKTDDSPEKVEWLTKRLISCKEYGADTPLEINKIDNEEWNNFKKIIENINKQIPDRLKKCIDDINLQKNIELRNITNKEIDEFIGKYSAYDSDKFTNYHKLENSPIFNYYYPLLKKEDFGNGSDYSDFIKSLCIRSQERQFKNSDYNPVVKSYQDLDVRPILEYEKKFQPYLDKNIGELEQFIKISKSISELEAEKINTQTKKEDIYEKIRKLENNKFFDSEMRSLKKEYENIQKIYNELHSLWDKVIQNFKKISDHTKEKKVGEIIKFNDPIDFIRIEVIDKDTQNRIDFEYSDKIYRCGVVYHGGTVPNLEQEGVLGKFIEKTDGYKKKSSGKAIYCCHVMKDVLGYPTGHIDDFSEQFPNACPYVYKLILKKGSLFFYSAWGDVVMQELEIENLKALKLCGVHSGKNIVNGPGTTEISIITPECVEKIEKLTLDQMKKIIDDEKGIASYVADSESIETWLKKFEYYQRKKGVFLENHN